MFAWSIFAALLAILFFLAGRSLASSGMPRGSAWPWITTSAILSLPLLFVQAFAVPTGAMENTILRGDLILVRYFPHSNPARGDIVAFIYPVDRKQTFVKRIVGIAGDRIRISHKAVFRNGVQLNEPYAVHKTEYEDSYRDNFPSEPNAPFLPSAQAMLSHNVTNGEVAVPPDKYFVLGDNRDSSFDSRYWGFVDSRDILGSPFLIYDSVDEPPGLSPSQQLFRIGHTRWSRIFKPL